ncbi:MAG: hypothetical protein P8R42_23265 [Candidatus Binatia bacterium]|nr:hypothetical protein [Candidatus Binatia bacterium]
MVGNNMMGLMRGCAVLLTGWHVQSNHCTWLGAGAAGFWIGSPGVVDGCTGHTLLSGNTIHTSKPTASLVRFGGAGSAMACAAVGIEGNLLMGWGGSRRHLQYGFPG